LQKNFKKNIMTKIITPQKRKVSVSVPQEYIGKPVAITMVLVGSKEDVKPKQTTRLSDKYRGVFSAENAKNFLNHTKEMRNEWNTI